MTARRTGIVSVAALAALTLTVGVVHAVAPDWSRRMGFDVWNIGEAEAEARDAAQVAHDLCRTGDLIGRQIEASGHVARALAAGRLTLAAAVEELARVNAARAAFLEALRCTNPSASDDRELLAWYALKKVWIELAADPSRQAEVMARLTGEFVALTGKPWVVWN